ncbi:MAG: TauD/TfdA family dioxygenase, partial [Brevundimonas sp.]|uniref:TauD/TfdA dioxygenase family protein n=2 Tax=unclassified Brevundimonas TaxID=2622653 RepID=UPI002735B519
MTKPATAPFVADRPRLAYRHIRVRALTPAIGAEIEGVDLTTDLSEAVFAEVERAFAENLVLFFRDQPMTPEQHLSFGRRFGALDIHPAAPSAAGYPELMIVAADEHSSRANGEAWHTDVSCNAEPPMGSILHIRTSPPVGGDTLFASMYAAWDALSDGMKARLSGLSAVHDGEHVYRGLYAGQGVADRPKYPSSTHPIARVHPVTGRTALFVNSGFTTRIVGLAPDESDALLKY